MKGLLLWVFLLCSSGLFANPDSIQLIGYLSPTVVAEAREKINVSESETLILEIDSSSASLSSVLGLAEHLYERKQQGTQIIVYIDGRAIGPVAILPFLADELWSDQFASWGDIYYQAEELVSKNLLRSSLMSLIPEANPKRILLAQAMLDSNLSVTDSSGHWTIDSKAKGRLISPAGEALVVSSAQLRQLALLKGILDPISFRSKFNSDYQPQNVGVAANLPKEEKLQQLLNPDTKSIGYLYIGGHDQGIDQSTWIYLRSALEHYKKTKPAFIVMELNTPGGEVFAAQRMSDALVQLDKKYNIPIVAVINDWAISAGAMLAYSSRFITSIPAASMGAAEPVFPTQGGMESAPEKINSALRADFANRARTYDRSPLLAEAMVDKDVVLVWRHGEIIKLDSNEDIRKDGTQPDQVITRKGKLLTLDGVQLESYQVSDLVLSKDPIAKEGIPNGVALLLAQEPFSQMANVQVDVFEMDWKGNFFAFLAQPAVASLLLLGVMMGFYAEMSTPGIGFPGIIALICLFFMALSSYSMEAAAWLELLLIAVGLALLALELFILPGFGIAGILGAVLCLGGLFGVLIPGAGSVSYDYSTSTFNAAGVAVLERLTWFSASMLIACILTFFLSRYMTPKLRAFSHLVLNDSQESSRGYVASSQEDAFPPIGSLGTVHAILRPAGKVEIQGDIYDAVSGGRFIPKGEGVVIVAVEAGHIVVMREEDAC